MNIDEAFKELGLTKTASEEEIKQKYKELAKKYHPDIFKDDPEKFKQINQAHDIVKDYQANPRKYDNPAPFGRTGTTYNNININDIFNNISNNQQSRKPARQVSQINIDITISFKEAVLGCDRPLQYKRDVKCPSCDGNGVKYKGNGCDSCNGFGHIIMNSKNMQFTKVCTKCYGRDIKHDECNCNDGMKAEDVSGSVSVSPGRKNGDVLRLTGKGNYVGATIFGEQYTDVFIKITVNKEEGLDLVENDVVSRINLSLLEAIQGCDKEVKTIHGMKSITIPKMSRNKEEISLPKMGVKDTPGRQRIIMDIHYPSEELTNKIIELLKEQNGDRT